MPPLAPPDGPTLTGANLKSGIVAELIQLADRLVVDSRLWFEGMRLDHTRFDEDPRFRRDYLPLHEFEDPWVTHFLGRPAFSGDYVRKDAVADKDERVRELQQTWPYRNP